VFLVQMKPASGANRRTKTIGDFGHHGIKEHASHCSVPFPPSRLVAIAFAICDTQSPRTAI
jgi:hypothetical protein